MTPRRWYSVALAALGVLAASGLFLLARPIEQDFKSAARPAVFALVQLSQQQPRILPAPRNASPQEESKFDSFRRTQIALLRSHSVLKTALRYPKVAALPLVQQQADPVAWLEKNLVVDSPDSPAIVRIGMSGGKTEDLVLLVNAVTDAYFSEIVNKEHYERAKRLDQMKDTYARLNEGLRSKKNALRALTEQLGSADMSRLLGEDHLRACQQELSKVRLGRIPLQARLARHQVAVKAGEDRKQAIKEIEEGIALLDEQERLLQEEIERGTAEHRAKNRRANDLGSLQDEIANADAIAKRIMREITAMEVEAKAPQSIRLLHAAEPTGGK